MTRGDFFSNMAGRGKRREQKMWPVPKRWIECKGPCLARCYRCSTPTAALAYLALGYLIASAVYLALTRRMGTPFADSLTDAQRAILRDSKRARRRAFVTGAAGAAVVLAAWRPLQHKRVPL